MADLKEYTVTIGGVEHTMQLSDEDAKRYGDAAKAEKSSTASNKSATASNRCGCRGTITSRSFGCFISSSR